MFVICIDDCKVSNENRDNELVSKIITNKTIMCITYIETEEEYEHSLAWIDLQFNKNLKPDSIEGRELKHVLALIKNYEDKHYPIPLC